MKVLVINAGSSSLKYQLIDMDNEAVIAKGLCERIGLEGSKLTHKVNGESYVTETAMTNHTQAFNAVKDALTTGEGKVVDDLNEITALGHRVVQGGSLFKDSCLVTDEVIAGIRELSPLAPLHNPAHIQGIEAAIDVFGKDVPQVVVFDTSFHSTMPPEAYIFGVPYEYYEKYAIRRYGFHGTSHRFVTNRCLELLGKSENPEGTRIINCHLGNGSSISAVKDGKVIDTSMGLTPLDGFIMGTRSGSLDPSVVTFIMEKEGLTPAQMDEILNKKSGLLGLSGVSSDDRDVTTAAREGNERAILTHKILEYQIAKFIGSYYVALGGMDALVFTAGIGENQTIHRTRICRLLECFGVEIDEEINAATHGREALISTPDSKVKVYVIPTNEELVIARDTKAIVEGMAK